jgi:predicted Fe-S protein YdhL (DUF1289 family)
MEMSMSDEVQSPCIDLCIMEDGVCTGCGMTQKESTNWPKMTNEERRKVIERLKKS